MTILRNAFIACLCFMFTGCAYEPSYRARYVRPAYPEMVVDCTFVGGVTGTSHLAYTPLGQQKAKYHAMDEAAKLGATHIVWVDLSQQAVPTAKGRAYICDEQVLHPVQDDTWPTYSY